MIRLGVIGHGFRMSGMIRNVFRKIEPGLRVVGLVDPDEKGARARLDECDRKDAVFYDSPGDLVKGAKPDALAIGTRCNLHASLAAGVAKFGLPLFLEKPVATTMRQAVMLERAFESNPCEVAVSFPLRVSPLCRLARQYVEEGAVGRPTHVAAFNYVPYGTVYWETLYRDHGITGGLFLQKATHDFDAIAFLMGEPITRVSAMLTAGRVFGGNKPSGLRCSQCPERETCLESPTNRRRNGSGGSHEDHLCVFGEDCGSAADGTLNEDCSSALLEFASGAHGVYTQVFYARRDAAARGATVSGYHGTVGFDWYSNRLRRVRHHAPFTAAEEMGKGMDHFGGDMELGHDFMGLIKGTAASRTPIKAGIQSVYACLAARQSARTGRLVKVRQVGQIC